MHANIRIGTDAEKWHDYGRLLAPILESERSCVLQPDSPRVTTRINPLVGVFLPFYHFWTGHLKPFYNHCLPFKTMYNEALFLWACTKYGPTNLTYSYSAPALDIKSQGPRAQNLNFEL